MVGEKDLAELIRTMSPKLNKGEYVFATVSDIDKINREDTIFEFKEEEGVTIVVERSKADELALSYEYISSWITLMVHFSLETIGLTALFSTEIVKYAISSNVVAGYYHDHIFVDKKDGKKAIKVLRGLSQK